MIIDRGPYRKPEILENLTPDEVIQKTTTALADPTVEAIETYPMGPRWERRKRQRAALRKKGKHRRYR